MTYNEFLNKAEKEEIQVKVSESKLLEEAAVEYLRLSDDIKKLKALQDKIKTKFKSATEKSPDGVVLVGNYKIQSVDVTKENFSIKDARAVLTDVQFNSVVVPFLSETDFKQLSVKKLDKDS